mmetsp:Transcript_14145/g.40207  ORF Transcript_14145/g.40207 Transcript_14145/m.40207 type:complete len:250 (+) Transcript_14145:1006-1755(+)
MAGPPPGPGQRGPNARRDGQAEGPRPQVDLGGPHGGHRRPARHAGRVRGFAPVPPAPPPAPHRGPAGVHGGPDPPARRHPPAAAPPDGLRQSHGLHPAARVGPPLPGRAGAEGHLGGGEREPAQAPAAPAAGRGGRGGADAGRRAADAARGGGAGPEPGEAQAADVSPGRPSGRHREALGVGPAGEGGVHRRRGGRLCARRLRAHRAAAREPPAHPGGVRARRRPSPPSWKVSSASWPAGPAPPPCPRP